MALSTRASCQCFRRHDFGAVRPSLSLVADPHRPFRSREFAVSARQDALGSRAAPSGSSGIAPIFSTASKGRHLKQVCAYVRRKAPKTSRENPPQGKTQTVRLTPCWRAARVIGAAGQPFGQEARRTERSVDYGEFQQHLGAEVGEYQQDESPHRPAHRIAAAPAKAPAAKEQDGEDEPGDQREDGVVGDR